VIQRTPASVSRSSRIRAGEHAAIPDHHHLLQSEALTQLADLRCHGLRIAGVPLENLYRHRAALVIGHQPEDDL
jgi:hypothetical protein